MNRASTSRLIALETLNEVFGAQSDVVARLREADAAGNPLSLLPNFWGSEIDFKPDAAKLAFLEQTVRSGADLAELDSEALNSGYILSRHFELGSSMFQRLQALNAAGLNTYRLAKFIDEAPVVHKALVENVVDSEASVKPLSLDRLKALEGFRTAFGRDSGELKRLLELEKQGLQLSAIHPFSKRASVVKELLHEGVSPTGISYKKLMERHSLNDTAKTLGDIYALLRA